MQGLGVRRTRETLKAAVGDALSRSSRWCSRRACERVMACPLARAAASTMFSVWADRIHAVG